MVDRRAWSMSQRIRTQNYTLKARRRRILRWIERRHKRRGKENEGYERILSGIDVGRRCRWTLKHQLKLKLPLGILSLFQRIRSRCICTSTSTLMAKTRRRWGWGWKQRRDENENGNGNGKGYREVSRWEGGRYCDWDYGFVEAAYKYRDTNDTFRLRPALLATTDTDADAALYSILPVYFIWHPFLESSSNVPLTASTPTSTSASVLTSTFIHKTPTPERWFRFRWILGILPRKGILRGGWGWGACNTELESRDLCQLGSDTKTYRSRLLY
ncbi:hypothetical protein D9758_015276 [Tetrapyrgos nigripes]|uniref:Uncharacterized protein n=1 Tax=Tetrapyrgos nigripes TaxID=182062 RepID=A0A8H5CPN6_9AGAR|nr:hypothetical protein D9758_015276 [Tetrapyrgos nigripes]